MSSADTDRLLNVALQRRVSLVQSGVTDAFRVVNGQADDLPGLVIDKFGPVLIVQLHEGRGTMSLDALRQPIERLLHKLGGRAAYLKQFVKDRNSAAANVDAGHQNALPWIGEPVERELVIHENDMRFLIRPYDGFSVGLFLEHRENRRRVRESSHDRAVLNLFAYTCGFSVAAALGGAREVTSVDLAKKMLEWGRANFRENGLDDSRHLFFCTDTFDFFKRAARQGRRYDLIVMDPPTFSRMRRPARVFELEARLPDLFSAAVALLNKGGTLFFATNHRQLAHRDVEAALRSAAAGRAFTITSRPELPIDFAGDPHYSRSLWAQFQ